MYAWVAATGCGRFGFVDQTTPTDDGVDAGEAVASPDATGAAMGGGYCYFTSYPGGSKQCIVGPCSVNANTTPTCTAPGYLNFASGKTIYGTYPDGQTVMIYPDAAKAFPACKGGVAVNGELANAGDYYATGLEAGAATAPEELATFCEAAPPAFSTQQCYFTSYPEGSKQCITAPCNVTNAASAVPTCNTGANGYLNFANGTTIYGTYASGQVTEIYLNAEETFPTCTAGATVGGEPSDAGDYYATGLVVGTASAAQVQAFCTTVLP